METDLLTNHNLEGIAVSTNTNIPRQTVSNRAGSWRIQVFGELLQVCIPQFPIRRCFMLGLVLGITMLSGAGTIELPMEKGGD